MLIKRQHVAACDGYTGFVNIGLGPCQIITLFRGAFSNALIDELTRRFLDRGKVAACDEGTQQCLLFWCKRDRHKYLIAQDEPLSTARLEHLDKVHDPTRYAMAVNGPWRITFKFDKGDVFQHGSSRPGPARAIAIG